MRLVVRLAPLVGLVAGCGFAQKPYADDPLLHGGRTIWSSYDTPPPVQAPAAPVPIEPPQPPRPQSREPRPDAVTTSQRPE
jgi:hypothetical protein